eukprot:1111435-Pyramimonas_sp.AAC.1
MRKQQHAMVNRLAELGLSSVDLKAAINDQMVSAALADKRLSVFIPDRLLKMYEPLTMVPECARKNLFTTRYNQRVCVIKRVTIPDLEERPGFQRQARGRTPAAAAPVSGQVGGCVLRGQVRLPPVLHSGLAHHPAPLAGGPGACDQNTTSTPRQKTDVLKYIKRLNLTAS